MRDVDWKFPNRVNWKLTDLKSSAKMQKDRPTLNLFLNIFELTISQRQNRIFIIISTNN